MSSLIRNLNPSSNEKSATNIQRWHPRWLEKWVIGAFVFLFLVLAGALISINYAVVHLNGIPLSLTHSHYAWTYGPTVILVVVVGFWRRINYCVMVNQPWYELSRGPQPADRTVLLDYLWPLQITSFCMAIKYRHFAVASSIATLALLKCIIVVSTTLFFPRESLLSRQVDISRDSTFNSSAFWGQRDQVTAPGTYGKYSTLAGNVTDTNPVWSYSELLSEYRNIAIPDDLSKAFTNFSVIPEIAGTPTDVRADIDIADVRVSCDTPAVVGKKMERGLISFELGTSLCDFGSIDEIPACIGIETYNTPGMCAGDTQIFYTKRIECDPVSPPRDPESDTLGYYAVIAVESYFETTEGGEFRNLSIATCKLEYSINRGIAHSSRLDSTGVETLDILDTVGQISNFTSSQLFDAVFDSLDAAYMKSKNQEVASRENGATALLGLMTTSAQSSSLDTFLNTKKLKSEAEKAIMGVSHQMLRRHLLLPSQGEPNVSGSVEYMERRLHTRPAALWGMVALFIVCACLGIVVASLTHSGVGPLSPAKLNTSRSVLSRSPTMIEVLKNLSEANSGDIRERIRRYEFMSCENEVGLLKIHATQSILPSNPDEQGLYDDEARRESKHSDLGNGMRWKWMPYSSRKHAILMTFLLTLLTIAALQILHHLSANDEFVTLSSESSIGAYAIQYGSTATVLIIATLFNALDFSVATMTPFSALTGRRSAIEAAGAEATMFFSMVEDLPPVALYKALRRRHFGAALSLLASTIGSVLTIVISGLWFYNTSIRVPLTVTAQLQSEWNVSTTDDMFPSFKGAAHFTETATGVIFSPGQVQGNMVFPAMGNGKAVNPFTRQVLTNGELPNYIQPMTALQPVLECSLLPSDATKLVLKKFEPYYTYPTFITTAQLPDGCHPANDSSSSTVSFGKEYDGTITDGAAQEMPPEDKQWLATLADLNVVSDPGNDRGCPSLGGMIGFWDKPNKIHQVTSVLCTQRIRSIDTNATFSPSESPGSPDTLVSYVDLNRTATLLTGGDSSLSYDISRIFENHVEYKGAYSQLEEWDAAEPVRVFGQFLSYLLDANSGIPVGSSMVTPHTPEKLLDDPDTLMSSMNDLYQQFMLHVLDLDLRTTTTTTTKTKETRRRDGEDDAAVVPPPDSSSSSSPNGATGTAFFTVARLKVNETSKTALQIMLAAMAILGGLSYWLVDMRGILPRNPYPIANSMVLFEGSRLLDSMYNNYHHEEEDDDMAIRLQRFRLGWWSTPPREEEEQMHEGDGYLSSMEKKTVVEGEEEEGERGTTPTTAMMLVRGGKRFGIDVMEDGLCSTGWVLVDRQSPQSEEWGVRS